MFLPAASFALVPMLPLVKAVELPPPRVKPVVAVELPPPDVKPVAAIELKPVAASEAPYPGQVFEVAQAETSARDVNAQSETPAVSVEEASTPLYPVPRRTGSKSQDFNPAVY